MSLFSIKSSSLSPPSSSIVSLPSPAFLMIGKAQLNHNFWYHLALAISDGLSVMLLSSTTTGDLPSVDLDESLTVDSTVYYSEIYLVTVNFSFLTFKFENCTSFSESNLYWSTWESELLLFLVIWVVSCSWTCCSSIYESLSESIS